MHAPSRPPVPVETLLLAYRSGIFPMADRRDDPEVFWVEPRERAIIPLEGLHLSKSLRKVLRADRFTVTVDQAFEAVIRACAEPRPEHPETWISERIVQSYLNLHRAGHAHSVECWLPGEEGGAPELAGGLYGVSFDRVFCGESMFSRVPDASKVALGEGSGAAGAVLALPEGFAALVAEAGGAGVSSSPGNFIAQSFTQTS